MAGRTMPAARPTLARSPQAGRPSPVGGGSAEKGAGSSGWKPISARTLRPTRFVSSRGARLAQGEQPAASRPRGFRTGEPDPPPQGDGGLPSSRARRLRGRRRAGLRTPRMGSGKRAPARRSKLAQRAPGRGIWELKCSVAMTVRFRGCSCLDGGQDRAEGFVAGHRAR